MRFATPSCAEIFEQIPQDCKCFASLDLKAAFYQLSTADPTIDGGLTYDLLAFVTHPIEIT
eukprot:SAG31_NODE_29714_length_391_cov_0.650685_2_plen_60_part_01